MPRCHFFRVVRMNADGGVYPIVLFGKGNRGIEFLRSGAGADCKKGRYARGACAFEHGRAIFRKLREIDVRMGIDQLHCFNTNVASGAERAYFKRAPISTSSSGKPARTGRPSGPTAAAMIDRKSVV